MTYKIAILGTGYVGLVCGVGLADFGNRVTCTDIDGEKIDLLARETIPFYEPGLEDYLKRNRKEGRFFLEKDPKKAIRDNDIIFIAVGTPSRDDGEADLSYLEEAVRTIARESKKPKIVVTKSTVSVGTNRWMKETLLHLNPAVSFLVVSNPEFLREGRAVQDFFHPDKVVIGTEEEEAREVMREIYRPLYLIDTPFVITNPETAELIKYACNAFLATKITFINEIANLCDRVGADVHQVAKAMGMDGRISPKFLHPGYGGSCFPKDTEALCSIAENLGYEFKTLKAVVSANKRKRELMVEKIKHHLEDLKGKTIAILGLVFKQNTDDIRKSPAIDIIQLLLKEGVYIRCFDPLAMENARKILPNLTYFQDEYETAQDGDALVIATEWNQFRNIDLSKIKKLLKSPILLDLRNLYDPATLKSLGFTYEGVGRK